VLDKWLLKLPITKTPSDKGLPPPPIGEEVYHDVDKAFDREVLNELLSYIEEDADAFLKRIVDNYFDSSEVLLKSLRQSVSNKDARDIMNAAHSMKSSSAGLGAKRLAHILNDLELSAKTNRLENAVQLLTMIDEEYPRVRDALLAELATMNAGQALQSVETEKLSTDSSPGASILVMDDEAVIREIATAMLEHLGYRITSCSNGHEAISRYKEALDSGAPFSAVIMDLGIPGGMGGEEAAKHILAIDLTARLVVSSGNPNDPAMSDYEKYGFCAALKKPYRMEELARQLAR